MKIFRNNVANGGKNKRVERLWSKMRKKFGNTFLMLERGREYWPPDKKIEKFTLQSIMHSKQPIRSQPIEKANIKLQGDLKKVFSGAKMETEKAC